MKTFWDNSDLEARKEQEKETTSSIRGRRRSRKKKDKKGRMTDTGMKTEEGAAGTSTEEKVETEMMKFLREMEERSGKKMEEMKIMVSINTTKLEEKIEDSNRRFEDTSREIRKEMKQGYDKLENKINSGMKEQISGLKNEMEMRMVFLTTEVMATKSECEKKNMELEEKCLNSYEKQKEKVDKELRHMGDKLNEWKGDYAQENSAVKERIRKIEGEVINRRVRLGGEGVNTIIYAGNNELGLPKFIPNDKYHPKSFINDLRDYLQNLEDQRGGSYNEFIEINTIRATLQGEAENWFNTIRNQCKNFVQFEEQFLKHYWGPSQQMDMQDKLYGGKYDWKGEVTRENYAINKLYLFQQFDEKLKPEYIIRQLARHFHYPIINKVLTENIKDYDKFIGILKGYDRVDEARKNNEEQEGNRQENRRQDNGNSGNNQRNYQNNSRGNGNYNRNYRGNRRYDNNNYQGNRNANQQNNRRENNQDRQRDNQRESYNREERPRYQERQMNNVTGERPGDFEEVQVEAQLHQQQDF